MCWRLRHPFRLSTSWSSVSCRMLPLCPPFLVWPSSQNLGTLFCWSSWFEQCVFFWYVSCQQVLNWCTSCPGKDSGPYEVGRGLPPAQPFKKSAPLGVSGHKWYPYQCILWSSKHSLCCFHRVWRFSFQTCFALIVCIESNESSFPQEERLVDRDVWFWRVYGGKLGF